MEVLGEPIDRLNGQLNAALVHIGRIFRDANRQDAKAQGRARGQETRMDTISKANTKFHEALDELEIEIVQAKSVMERDLNRLRHARLEHEQAHDMSKQDLPSSMLSDTLAGAMDLSADAFADTSLLAQISGMNGVHPEEDIATAPSDLAAAPAADGEAENANTDAIVTQADSASQNPAASGEGGDANAAFDFEGMFDSTGGSNALDLDFGAGLPSASYAGDASGTAGSIDDLFNSADDFADLDGASNNAVGDGQQGQGGGGTAEDLDALLPGLGSYVNVENNDLGGEDFAMIDMPTGSMDLADAQENGQKKDDTVNGDSQAVGESNAGGEAAGSNAQDGSGGDQDAGFGDMDDIFGDMMDVGNMDGATLDDFDWGA